MIFKKKLFKYAVPYPTIIMSFNNVRSYAKCVINKS